MQVKIIYRHLKKSVSEKRKEESRPYLLKLLETIDVDEVWRSSITPLLIDAKNGLTNHAVLRYRNIVLMRATK